VPFPSQLVELLPVAFLQGVPRLAVPSAPTRTLLAQLLARVGRQVRDRPFAPGSLLGIAYVAPRSSLIMPSGASYSYLLQVPWDVSVTQRTAASLMP
jgi:hypothetical protein